MSGKIRHVDLYPDEWLTGTASLDPVEIGIYITACAMIYSHGGPIPKSELRLRIRCHGHTFNRAYGHLVALGKLNEEDGQITNKRCANELQKAQERTEKAQQNGGKGGRPRNENNDITNPDGFQAGKLTTNHQPPTAEEEGSVGSNEPTSAGALPEGRPDLAVVAGTDVTNPEPQAELKLDAGAYVFGPCRQWLQAKYPKQPDSRVRRQLGAWCRDYGEGLVIQAFDIAAKKNPGDAHAWIEATLKRLMAPTERASGYDEYDPLYPSKGTADDPALRRRV